MVRSHLHQGAFGNEKGGELIEEAGPHSTPWLPEGVGMPAMEQGNDTGRTTSTASVLYQHQLLQQMLCPVSDTNFSNHLRARVGCKLSVPSVSAL